MVQLEVVEASVQLVVVVSEKVSLIQMVAVTVFLILVSLILLRTCWVSSLKLMVVRLKKVFLTQLVVVTASLIVVVLVAVSVQLTGVMVSSMELVVLWKAFLIQPEVVMVEVSLI